MRALETVVDLLGRALPASMMFDVDRRRRASLAIGIAWFVVVTGVALGVVFGS